MVIQTTHNIPQVSEVQKLKEQGRSYLKSNQMDKALRIFAIILRENPDDVEAMLILGDAYLIVGERAEALTLYRQACRLAPERKEIKRRVTLLQENEKEIEGDGSSLTQPRAVADLIQRLTGQTTSVTEKEITQASQMLEEYLESSSPENAVVAHLSEMDSWLPALIEMNVRQAQEEGREDLVDALQNLLANVLLEVDLTPDENHDTDKPILVAENESPTRVLVAGINSNDSPFRQHLLAQVLSDIGYAVTEEYKNFKNILWEAFDIVIVHNPHGSTEIVRGIATRSAMRLPVIVDLDTDFEKMPPEHPEYARLGLGKLVQKRTYRAALQLADQICVSNDSVAAQLQQEGYSVNIIPDGWSQYNFLWHKPSPPRNTYNIGLNVSPGQVEDVASIRRSIIRIMREMPFTRLLVSGDVEVFQMFETLPDVRRQFLPTPDVEDYPYLLSQFDLLLAPAKDLPFNQLQSDRKVMEAGVRKIPWVGTPIHSHLLWSSGGLLAYSGDDWYTHIHEIIRDRDLQAQLGEAGHQKALLRENQYLGRLWNAVIQKLLVPARRI